MDKNNTSQASGRRGGTDNNNTYAGSNKIRTYGGSDNNNNSRHSNNNIRDKWIRTTPVRHQEDAEAQIITTRTQAAIRYGHTEAAIITTTVGIVITTYGING